MEVKIYRSEGRVVLLERGRELGLKPKLVKAILSWIKGSAIPKILEPYRPIQVQYAESSSLKGDAAPSGYSSKWSNHRR